MRDYYSYPKDSMSRWLGNSVPSDIGGRDTDVSQICYSLEHLMKDAYPINKVPKEFVQYMKVLIDDAEHLEAKIQRLIDMVAEDLAE